MAHCDPVDTSAALICNGRHFVWLIVRAGGGGCRGWAATLPYVHGFAIAAALKWPRRDYARTAARTVPLNKAASANWVPA